MAEINSLESVLVEELKDIFNAENQLLKALPKMIKATTTASLKMAFQGHLEETKVQVERLNQIAEILDVKLTGKTCKAMKGLVEEGKEAMEENVSSPELKDLLIAGAALRVEHYEIAAYTHVCCIAEKCESKEVFNLLKSNLQEEKKAEEMVYKLISSEIVSNLMEAHTPDMKKFKAANKEMPAHN